MTTRLVGATGGEVVVAALAAHGVDLVLGGHSHAYERTFFIQGHYGARDPVSLENQWCFPTSYESDDLTNIEAGWKTQFWGGRAQFNGSIYQVKWTDAQTGLFAPELGFPNLQSFLNGPEYEVNGVEFNFVVAPPGPRRPCSPGPAPLLLDLRSARVRQRCPWPHATAEPRARRRVPPPTARPSRRAGGGAAYQKSARASWLIDSS